MTLSLADTRVAVIGLGYGSLVEFTSTSTRFDINRRVEELLGGHDATLEVEI